MSLYEQAAAMVTRL